MKPLRVYIDTSVVGGCFDPEFREASLELFSRFRSGTMMAVVSDLTTSEVERAPPAVRNMLASIPSEYVEYVLVTREASELANRYIAAGVVGRSMLGDAEHIAAATIHQVDILVSWNFKHIVNPRRIDGYNLINLSERRAPVEIRTPMEVIGNER